ncbi:MAG: hypothetical protein RLZZ252_1875, partial [Bacteroidota bacterium]
FKISLLEPITIAKIYTCKGISICINLQLIVFEMIAIGENSFILAIYESFINHWISIKYC